MRRCSSGDGGPGMQSILECTVCTSLYHPTSRVPKTLGCGHVFCVQCLWSLLSGCDVKCPKCRALTTVPLVNIDRLPTSFATIDYLESTCEECRRQPWRKRCEDSGRNLCDSCLESHLAGSGAESKRSTLESAKLKAGIATLQVLIAKDTTLSDISTNADDVIRAVKKAHETRMELLRSHQEELVSQVKSEVKQSLERQLSWRETSARALVEATILHDRCRSLRRLAPMAEGEYAELNAKCDEQGRLLQTQIDSKPHLEQIVYRSEPVDLDALIVGCGDISVQELNKLPVASNIGPSADERSDQVKKFEDLDDSEVFFSSIATAKTSFDPSEAVCDSESYPTIQQEMNSPEIDSERGAETPDLSSEQLPDTGQQTAPDYSELVVKEIVGCRGKGSEEFNGPTGICQSALTGCIFVTDCNNHRVMRLSQDWKFVGSFGRPGRGEGDFMNPSGVVAEGGRVLVVDRNNHRIQVLEEDGSYLYTVGRLGSDPGEFCYPGHLALSPSGEVYVSDSLNNRLQVIEPGSASAVVFGGDGGRCGAHISHPGPVACGGHQVLVGDDRGDLLVFSRGGAHLRTLRIAGGGECLMSGVVFDPRGWLVLVDRAGSLVVLDTEGQMVCQIGQVGAGSGEFCKPEGVCWMEPSGLAVCDTDNHRVQVLGYLDHS